MRANLILILLISFSVIHFTDSYEIQNIYPKRGPHIGLTRVNIFTTDFRGLNYSDHPNPQCQFGDKPKVHASWVHCRGSASKVIGADPIEKIETCLTCMSPEVSGAMNVTLTIFLDGDDVYELITSFEYYLQPKVLWAVPFIGKRAGGTQVKVHGENFRNFSTELFCGFGTIYVPARYESENLLHCESPPSDIVDTPLPLTVSMNIQDVTDTRITYYYYTFPQISQLIPNRGPSTGGNQVHLKGKMLYPFSVSNLDIDNTTWVRFGTVYMNPDFINSTHMNVTAPPSYVEGSVIVELTFNDQEWTNDGIQYFYYSPSYAYDLIPNKGHISGYTNVTVYGANFFQSKDIKCKFGDKVVPGYYIDYNHIWTLSPPVYDPGFVSFDLTLKEDDYIGTNLRYLYYDNPSVKTFSPECGPSSGGTQITITGQEFFNMGKGMAFCIFGGNTWQPAIIFNDSLIYCNTPSVLDKFGNNVNGTKSYSVEITLDKVNRMKAPFNFTFYTQPSIQLISPLVGHISGGNNIIIQGSDFSKSCKITVRFATIEVPGTLISNNKIKVISPPVTCSGEALIQISLNGQQYSSNQYTLDETVYSYYNDIISSYFHPKRFTTAGGSKIDIYGNAFMFSKNVTTNRDGTSRVDYWLRFKDHYTGSVLAQTKSIDIKEDKITAKSPAFSNPSPAVDIEISPNGENWHPTTGTAVIVAAPVVGQITPTFGKIKQVGTTLNVTGKGFKCEVENCPDAVAVFSHDNFDYTTKATVVNETFMICEIPFVSIPEIYSFKVAPNGYDFSAEDVTYTFYEPYIVKLIPDLIPTDDSTKVRVIGFGFADTKQIKIKLARNNVPLLCSGTPCILEGTYITQKELTFIALPQEKVSYSQTGLNIGFDPFPVEASMINDEYTNNNIPLRYFEQPLIGKLTPDGSPYLFHSGSVESLFLPIELKVPPGMDPNIFISKLTLVCKYSFKNEKGESSTIVQASLHKSPLPYNNQFPTTTVINCKVPNLPSTGIGKLSIAINGVSFVGDVSIFALDKLTTSNLSPQCGPLEGSNAVSFFTQGLYTYDTDKSWITFSTQCGTKGLTKYLTGNQTLKMPSPKVDDATSNGGIDLVYFSNDKEYQVKTFDRYVRTQTHYESSIEFQYYRQPIVTAIYPHSGSYKGGTTITIEGVDFFSEPKANCVPKCKFGDKLVPANFVSTIRLTCQVPAGDIESRVTIGVTMNGFEPAKMTQNHFFMYTDNAKIDNISPQTGPSTGGTIIVVTGTGFADLNSYSDEFLCIFTSHNLDIPQKRTSARYINSTAVSCVSPGGWGSGNIASLDLTFNGVDIIPTNKEFRFYQVDNVFPLSGPSESLGNLLTIVGSGFIANSGVSCKFGNTYKPAVSVNWTHIQCIIPDAETFDFYGRADLLYSLNGKDWNSILQGFYYYLQPEIKEISPGFISAQGGVVYVFGEHFYSDFPGALLTCKVADTIVPGAIVNATNMICKFENGIKLGNHRITHLQIALNNISYTKETKESRIYVYEVSDITPKSGVSRGGTPIHVKGTGFSRNYKPICVFGAKGSSSTTYGTVISENELICTSPALDIPDGADYPFQMSFSISFEGFSASKNQ